MLEVFIALSIMLMLVSLLIGGVVNTKNTGKRVYCLNNLKQIQTVIELYKKDNKFQTPYTEDWLIDFRFCSPYFTSYDVFTCPGSDDEKITSADQLLGSTSYYYVPSKKDWLNNTSDGQTLGWSDNLITQLDESDELVVYDKSPSHHNGYVNAVYVNGASLDGKSATSYITKDLGNANLWEIDSSGNLVDTTTEVASAEVIEEIKNKILGPNNNNNNNNDEEPQIDPNTKYTITASVIGGSLNVNATTEVNHGDSLTVNFTPNGGYELKQVTVDGVKIEATDSYNFANIQADANIHVEFKQTALFVR